MKDSIDEKEYFDFEENYHNQDNEFTSTYDEDGLEYGPVKKGKIFNKGTSIFLAFIFLLLALSLGFVGGLLAKESPVTLLPERAIQGNSEVSLNLEKATDSEMTIQEIVHAAADAVVEIRTEAVATDFWLGQYITRGAGSGVIVKDDGFIVTNNHVIAGATKITVTLRNGNTYVAKLIATDPQTDIAVIKIQGHDFKVAVLGDSSSLLVGDLAVAIGNPLGQLGGTATAGIISALDRSVTVENKSMKLLQTDASINPGNSGGGLFNQFGQLIGIVVAKSGGSNVEGLAFAIPSNTAKPVIESLMSKGYIEGRVQMGLTLLDIKSPDDAIRYGVKALGVYIVSADTAESKSAGFKEGDRILTIEENVVNGYEDISPILEKYKVGDLIKVVVDRESQTKILTLRLQEKRP